MSIILEKNDQKEKIMDNAARLEVTADGIQINTLFEPPQLVAGVVLKEIDFLDGVVTLVQR
nr:CooT family nickel-binding protein [Desulfobulbaceae bacterium]